MLSVLLLSTVAELAVFPPAIALDGPEAVANVIVHERDGEVVTAPVPVVGDDGATLTVADESVAVVRGGRVVPKANGETTLTVTRGEQTATVPITVSRMDQPFEWSFRNHTLPVLSKNGCNMGACHGALAGKGGFRLSLRGFDPAADWQTITRESRGRRTNLADPGRSLLLAKPSGAIAHKGGLRLKTDSDDYRVVAEWIAAGAPGPQDDDPTLVAVSVYPPLARLTEGQSEQLVVWAEYSDGRKEDITRWAKFESADATVAKVSDEGRVEVIGSGEGAVSAWFSSQIAMARVSSPYPNDVPEPLYAESPQNNWIDELVVEQLRRLNLPPSPPCTDAEFLRRASLDATGTLPSPEKVREFLASDDADKRAKLVDELLASDGYVDYWAYKWSDVLLVNGNLLRPMAVEAYYGWIRENVEQNTPWDELVRELVTAQGDSIENGATNFFALHQDPENMTENVCKAFMGLSIGCAKCHNHPLEKWTNDQYYGMASYFSRVKAKGWGGDGRNGDGVRMLVVTDAGELVQPNTGKVQPPTPLDGEPLPLDAAGDRRQHLAQWLTAPENPYFTKAIANRVWENFLGVGLVDEVDDLRISNPASNEKLLQAAADRLIEYDYDLKRLMRDVMTSAAYQRSAVPVTEANSSVRGPGNATESRFYSRFYPRRLQAEVLLDAITANTGVSESFTEVVFPGDDKQKTDFYGEGTRALELYDSAVGSYFLSTFGRNDREITCECERTDAPSMVQVLHLSNGTTINDRLKSEKSKLSRWIADGWGDGRILEEMYLTSLGRLPSKAEQLGILELLPDAQAVAGDEAAAAERKVILEDTYWALLSSREFLFNR